MSFNKKSTSQAIKRILMIRYLKISGRRWKKQERKTRNKILDVLTSGELQRLEMSVGLSEKSVLYKVGYIRFFSLEQ